MTAHRAQIMDFSSDVHPAKVTFKVLTCNTFASYSNLCRTSMCALHRGSGRFGLPRARARVQAKRSGQVGKEIER